jgi:hypothetical protein
MTNDDDDDDDDDNDADRVMRQINATKVFSSRRSWNVYKLLF